MAATVAASVILLFTGTPALTPLPQPIKQEIRIDEVVNTPKVSISITKLRAIATSTAEFYNLSEEETRQMMGVIQCESGWNPAAIGALGEVGLVQIYPKAHPDVTIEQMKDPNYSIDFIARHFAGGDKKPWTCYHILYG